MKRASLCAAALALGLAGAWPAAASDEALVLRQRAEQLAAQDRCDEALPRVRRARELAPDDARAAWIEGRCLLHQALYADALAPLERAAELDPSLPGVHTDLAQAYYHLDQLANASAALEAAEAQDPDDARMHLYRGLVLLRDAREREAAEAFDRASALDETLAPAASLYSARSWQAVRDRDKAAAALERARRAEPGSEWAEAAERELDALNEPYERHVWARVQGGVEYDDNVPLRSTANPQLFGTNRRKRHDVKLAFEADAGAELLRDPDRSLGIAAGYRGSVHLQRHNQFDLQNPWGSLWYDQRLGEDTWLRLQPYGGYAWLEKDPFLAHGGGLVSLTHDFSERLAGQLFTRVTVNDYLFRIQPPGGALAPISNQVRRRRNRDGVAYEGGVEGHYEVAATDTRLFVGSAYERYEAEGKDWDRHGVHGWAGFVQPLPLPIDLRFEAEGGFRYHDYDSRSSFLAVPTFLSGGGAERIDRIWDVETALIWDVTRWLALSARWSYVDSNSNTAVFDYDRHIVGGYLTLYFGT